MPRPRNDFDELRLALSYDDLKMKGIVQSRADFLELTGDVDLQLLRFDDARAGDQEQRPVQSDLESAEIHRGPGDELRACARRLAVRDLAALKRRFDERDEQRMPATRIRREFGVELASEEPRMIG